MGRTSLVPPTESTIANSTWASAAALELDLVIHWFRLEASLTRNDDDALKQIYIKINIGRLHSLHKIKNIKDWRFLFCWFLREDNFIYIFVISNSV